MSVADYDKCYRLLMFKNGYKYRPVNSLSKEALIETVGRLPKGISWTLINFNDKIIDSGISA